MAGHNKWSKVKHKKGAADAKRSKVWTKIIREVTLAARIGGEDPGSNPRLRKALDDARMANMPKDTLNKAIARASESQSGTDMEELTYEGYGPGGVAILVECLTDNRNRTSGDVRSAFNKKGGNLGSTGSVSFGFKKLGQIIFDKDKSVSEEKLMELGLENGLHDIQEDEDSFTVSCEPVDFLQLKDAFEKAGLVPASAEVAMVADNSVHISGEGAKSLLNLIDTLEDLDDVQHVWTNMDIDEGELERLMS